MSAASFFAWGGCLGMPKGPGIILVFAPIDRIVRVSLRQEALEVPPQDIITRDNVTLKVNAVIFLRVVDPNKAVVAVSNYMYQTSQFAQTTLRSVLGEVELDELLAHREKINLRLQSILDQHTDPWGVKVTNVEVKQVDLPETMTRAMAKQAEAEREKRSKIIHAEGEFAAAQRLIDAAHLLAYGAHQHSVAIFANLDRNRSGEEYDHHLPSAGGLAGRTAEPGASGPGENRRLRAAGEIARNVRNMASDDTEITLGMGKLLGLFFLLAAICGVFFSIGYSLGKSTGREQALNDQPATTTTQPAETSCQRQPEQAFRCGRGEGGS